MNLDDQYQEWLRELEEDVIQGEYSYEPGEFTVYSSHWRRLYDEGLAPLAAWKRALDGYANSRREADDQKTANYARIIAEDEAAVARARTSGK